MTALDAPRRAAARYEAGWGDQSLALDTLARTLWGEARGEGRHGMQAVANVILNRAAKPGWWGRSVAEVCLRPRQFSCWLPDDPNRPKLLRVEPSDAAFSIALEIATRALAGSLPDITHGSTHYHSLDVAPVWAQGRTPCVVIGRHAFYNDID